MKKLIWISIIVLGMAFLGYLYVFHKPHRDVAGEAASQTLAASTLVDQFNNDRSLADSLYLDQVIAVKGKLAKIDGDAINLEEGIYAKLDSNATMPNLKPGDSISIKGRVIGFDDLFGEVRLDFASVDDQ